MRLLMLSAGQDAAGEGYRLKLALEKHAGWHVVQFIAHETYLEYPYDRFYSRALVDELWAQADLVHLAQTAFLYVRHDANWRKPVVIHHQGTLRYAVDAIAREARSIGALSTVSTTDMLDDMPEAFWMPTTFDVDVLQAYRRERRDGRIVVAQSPTNHVAKSTDLVIAAAQALGLTLDIIESVPHVQALARKGRADIVVDQLELGIGASGVEAMSMGIPVVAGFAEESDAQLWLRETGCDDFPFFYATRQTLTDALQALTSEDLRAEYARRGREYVERVHSEAAVAARAVRVFGRAKRSLGRARAVMADWREYSTEKLFPTLAAVEVR